MAKHFRSRAFTAAEEESLAFWVRNNEWLAVEERNSQGLTLRGQLISHVEHIYSKAQDIMDGVATISDDTGEETISYRLPSALVRAFESIFVFLVASGYAVTLIDRKVADKTSKKSEGHMSLASEYRSFMNFLGFGADVAMTKALKAVVLRTRTGGASEFVNFTAVGLRHIVLVLSKTLLLRNLTEDADIVTIYRNCISKLVSCHSNLPLIS
jgi:hypothetical protein